MPTLPLFLASMALAQAPAGAPEQKPYFEQEVKYRIEALLDDEAEVLHGRARVRYTNRSPDALDTLYFHLYLNAFRPNSAWARRDLEFGERRFQDLGPDEWAYERLKSVVVDGAEVTPRYPGAPDSTVVAIPLAEPLGPGESVRVDLDWDARPSTLPRRQGRRGRHYDFAQWFPIVAVYDRWGWEAHPLLPQGEFYGEFMDFDVTLDVAADQVIGATGVPVEGDPGWEAAAAPGYADSLYYKRDAYGDVGAAESLGLLAARAQPGRKRVRWMAEDVHNFAWSTSPDYIYEGGRWGDVAIHVLYQPGDTAWARGQALRNTKTALEWLDSIYGPFAWPQITNLHRIESGGTEFPMMVMNGGASLSLILHEVGHNYTMGILANNEWKQGFLDEGFTSFQTNWYFQTHGRPDVWDRTFERMAEWERAGMSQPLIMESADFRDFRTYNTMTYTKPSIVYRMLQGYLGDAAFREGLRRYYRENRLNHVTLADFQAAMEAASGQELDWFFDQWFRTTRTLDYAIRSATTTRRADGSWETRVEVERTGEAWMPVTLEVAGVRKVLDSRERIQTVAVVTPERPDAVVLDPDTAVLETDRSNNRRAVE
ncbi:MAG TPA: M1 family metallopeptidase [Longimicrobiales bacterium]